MNSYIGFVPFYFLQFIHQFLQFGNVYFLLLINYMKFDSTIINYSSTSLLDLYLLNSVIINEDNF